MTVFCVNSGTTYADITAADAAESGIDYGTPTIFEQSGASTSAVVFSNADYPSSFVYRAASGQETDGTTSTGAQCTGQITSSVANHEFLNLRTGRISINFSTAGGANLENLVMDGTGGDPILFPTSPTAQTMTNVIVYNCSDAWRATSTNDNVIATNCTAVDCTGFGFLRPRCVGTVALNTGSAAYLQVGASSSNYWADDGTGSNAITESPTTDIFVDYANGDYRILASSSVGTAGAGAFIQSGGGGVTATVGFNVPSPTFSVNASNTQPSTTATVSFDIPSPLFNVSASVTSPTFEASVNFDVPSPTFTVSASNTRPEFNAAVDFDVAAPEFSVTATNTQPGFNANVAFDVPSPQFSVSASVTFPAFEATIGFEVPSPEFFITDIPASGDFIGVLKSATFSGIIKEFNIYGVVKQSVFSGNLKPENTFIGTLKQSTFRGIRNGNS